MVVCIYGFPTNVSALQFEWAWQHPQESAAMRQAAATFKSFSGVTNKIKLAYTMLTLPAWQSLNITVNYFSTKYTNHSASCPSLPEQMKVKVSPMDELPCYTEPNEFEYKDDCDNLDEYDEVSDTCETVPETYPNEVVIVSADNLHSIIHEACHEQSEHIEEYETRKPGESSNLGVDMSIAGKESLRGMRFKYAVEADEDPQPLVKEKQSTTDEEYEKLGDTCTFGVYHRQPFDVICSPVRASSSVVTRLSNEETAERTNISITEKECRIQKQFSAFAAASGDQQSWRKGKPLTTEVAVLKDHVPSFDVTREPENVGHELTGGLAGPRVIVLSLKSTGRDEIGGSSSNGRNQDDSLIKHGEYWAQHDELHGACFNASEVTTGKTNDNTNDGMVEISDDERLDKMLEFSSKNIWEHVESDEFMEHVRQGLDSQPSSLGGNQATLIQLPSHILLNHDPLISPAGRVGDHVDNDHRGVQPLNPDPLISSASRVGDHVDSDPHGLCVPENMEDSQKVSCFHQLIIPYEHFADRVDQLSKSQDRSKGERQVSHCFLSCGIY